MKTETGKTGGGTQGQQNRNLTIPANLTKPVSTFDQFQQRLQELGNHFGIGGQLCSAAGTMIVPGNTVPTQYARVWLPNGQTIADVGASQLETCVNRAIEDAGYWLAQQSGTWQTGEPRARGTAGNLRKTGT